MSPDARPVRRRTKMTGAPARGRERCTLRMTCGAVVISVIIELAPSWT